jgi:hypothetical protein
MITVFALTPVHTADSKPTVFALISVHTADSKPTVFALISVHTADSDTKGVIKSCYSKKCRQYMYNSRKKKDKSTNYDLQNTTQKTKDQSTRTTIKNRG